MLDFRGYSVSFASVPLIFTLIAILLLGVLTLIRERISLVSVSFFLITLVVSIWLAAFAAMYAAPDAGRALDWVHAAYFGIPFIPAATYQFTVSVLRVYPRYRVRVWLAWLLAATFALACWTTSVLVTGLTSYWWGAYPRYGWLGGAFILFVFAMLAASMRHYLRAYRLAESDADRRRIRALMIAFAAGYLGGIDFVAAYGVPLYPCGYLGIFGFVILAARAIWVYHLVPITPAFAAQQIIDTMSDALIVLDPDGRVRVINQAAADLLDQAPAALVGCSLSSLVDLAPVLRQVAAVYTGGPVREVELAYQPPGRPARVLSLSASPLRNPRGQLMAIVCTVQDLTARKRAEDEIRHLNAHLEQRVRERTLALEAANAALATDIAARKALEAELAFQAFHDSLTGLPNRALFAERLEEALARVQDGAPRLAVLFLDLDGFKIINDTLGHKTGDQLLWLAARRLQTCMRPTDMIARQGGDEFTVLLEGLTDLRAVALLSERIAAALTAPFPLAGRDLFVTVSIGIALSDGEANQPDELLRRADVAMYAAKQAGKARIALYDPCSPARAWDAAGGLPASGGLAAAPSPQPPSAASSPVRPPVLPPGPGGGCLPPPTGVFPASRAGGEGR